MSRIGIIGSVGLVLVAVCLVFIMIKTMMQSYPKELLNPTKNEQENDFPAPLAKP